MPLTERELAILSVAVTELLNHDYRPFDDQIIIQVATNFARSTWHRSCPFIMPCLIPSGKYIVSGRWTLLNHKDIDTCCVSSLWDIVSLQEV
ncbi:Uncharacterized protein SCF082_LOCUS7226 [Durusdinium trenchii]|uniref:Uncharacterized protein n=1 Tax=Durusdinium trenchii TaxID=1381693 RepID=A0ABP0ILE9_9DINO